MEILGIQFASLNIPVHRRLETFSAFCWIFLMLLGGVVGHLIIGYILFFTRFYHIALLYLAWMVFDKETPHNGGRTKMWVRSLTLWRYYRDYFPVNLVKTSDLDPSKNYLFCTFPHGILSSGAFASFATEANNFKEQFPGIKLNVFTLNLHFRAPLFREFIMALGGLASSEKSISHLLGSPEGGRAGVLVVGGAAEAFECRPGVYRLYLKSRRGFARLALKHGASLVPVFSFGETDLFDQIGKDGSFIRTIQQWFKKITGIAPVLLVGRGIFQYTFGILPRRVPVTTVVGEPIEVNKTAEPSQEEIDKLHKIFVEKITEMFDREKFKYLENAENIQLEII